MDAVIEMTGRMLTECQHCQQDIIYSVPAELQGKEPPKDMESVVKCPNCGAVNALPPPKSDQ